MPKKIDQDLKAECYRYFVLEGLGVSEISKKTGVSERNLRRWITDDDDRWKKEQALGQSSVINIVLHALKQIHRIYLDADAENRALTKTEADIISKLNKNIQTVDPKSTRVTNGIRVLGDFVPFLIDRFPAIADELNQAAMEYANQMAEHYTTFKWHLTSDG